MKTKFVLPISLLAAAVCTTAADTPRVSRPLLATIEKSLDDRISKLWVDNPLALMGSTRGVYLAGYGAVFTTEVNMAIGGATLMHTQWTKADKDRHHQQKIERLPQLKQLLKQTLLESAALPALDAVPLDEQIYLAAFLSRYPWEDPSGIPAQVIVQAPKKKLLEVQRAGGAAAALDQVVRVTEF